VIGTVVFSSPPPLDPSRFCRFGGNALPDPQLFVPMSMFAARSVQMRLGIFLTESALAERSLHLVYLPLIQGQSHWPKRENKEQSISEHGHAHVEDAANTYIAMLDEPV